MTSSDTASAEVLIRNEKGLHARASAKFVKCAETFDATIEVTKDGHSVGGTSIMGLLLMAAGCGSTIQFSSSGADAVETLAARVALIGSG